ncbi:MAG: 3-hydroxyacyl-CoA dehydrogenase/enoyl-CoA hydratase family protein, partial [Planctomycetota bacterium]
VLDDYAAFFRGIGKKPVIGRDTPNFIANRIGVYSMLKVMRLAEKYRLSIEQVDMITGSPLGHPKSASYRLADMVGLDTLLHVTTNSYDSCPDDEVRDELQPPALLAKMVEAGRLGQKTGEGFYKKAGKGKILVLDPETFEYKPISKPRADRVRVAKGYPKVADRLRVMCTGGDDPISAFARELVLATAAYSLNRLGEVTGDIFTIDNALKWGFGREIGPIEALDAIGLEQAASMMKDLQIPVPAPMQKAIETTGSFYGDDGAGRTQFFVPEKGALETVPDDPTEVSLRRLKADGKIVRENLNARLIDMGDGVLLCELDAKMVPAMNPVDDYIMSMMDRAYEEVESGKFRALVIGNQAPHFCAGANLKAVLELAKAERWDTIRDMTAKLQTVNMRNLHAPFPVVTAPHGMTLGGGLEIALGGQVRVLLSELYCGLVEVGVGLIPAGGGCLRLLQLLSERRNKRKRPLGVMQTAMAAFDLIGFGKVSSSADDARGKYLVRRDDVICFSKAEQLKKAKEVALARLDGFEPIPETPVSLAGRSGYLVMEDTINGMLRGGKITEHAAAIAKVQARILTGDDASPVVPVSEARILELERDGFVELVKTAKTQERMAYMLKKGKPLFN